MIDATVAGTGGASADSTRALTGTVVQDVWDLLDSDPRHLGDVRLVKRLKVDQRPIHDRKMTPFLGERGGDWVVVKAVRQGALAEQLAAEVDAAARWGLAVANPLGNDGQYAWVVRRFVDGRTLSGLRSRPDFAENRETLARMLLQRIADVHAAGGHHGDIKPSNVLVTPDLTVQLIDFESAHSGHARASIRHLTPEFAAPEHFNLDQTVGQPSDIFSWGLTVADMYAPGLHPFLPGTFSTERLNRAFIAGERLPDLSAIESHPLRTAVAAALRLPPAARPGATALINDLDRTRPTENPPTLTMEPGLGTTTVISPAGETRSESPAPVPAAEPDLPRSVITLVFGATGYPGRRHLTWQLVAAYGLTGVVLAFLTALVLFVLLSSVGVWLQP
ncbi:protein kinase domain-containing protein [Enemella sp. A6]|uniref:protein kinase domain-containing protein n=1 Tax=Enemella sp. A6 TaxID=3440152 RepID=UPI003EBCABCB